MEPSGSDKGFFQEAPVLRNPFHDDASLQRCLKLFVPPRVRNEIAPEIAQVGEDVISDAVFAWITDAERNLPYLKGSGRDAFGRPTSELVTGEGWRRLQEFGIRHGFVAAGYDLPYGHLNRVIQFIRLHLFEPSSANVTCPSAMSDGAAKLLSLHLADRNLPAAERAVFGNALGHLVSRDPRYCWTSGQWMTERSGGSDVSQTETVATLVTNPWLPSPSASSPQQQLADVQEGTPLGPWSVSGFKWFSSATDASMTILLARTGPTTTNPQGGISAFFAPMRRHDPNARTLTGVTPSGASAAATRLNGVRIQRLKNKFGTRPLPTAELELSDMRAWLVGAAGRGVQEISTVLTITRIHSATASLGYLGRGLAAARAYARVRQVGAGRGRRVLLAQSALHMRTLAGMATRYHGMMLLWGLTTYVLGLDEHPTTAGRTSDDMTPALQKLTPPREEVSPLLRVLAPLLKAYVCKEAVPLMFACMEALGGLGYLVNEEREPVNLSRIFRDLCVNAIWEGTTDVLATDFVRALKHPRGGEESLAALDGFVRRNGWAGTDASLLPGRSENQDGRGHRHGHGTGWTPLAAWETVRERIRGAGEAELAGEARTLLWAVAEVLISVLMRVDYDSGPTAVGKDMLDDFVAERAGSAWALGKGVAAERRLERDRAIVYGGEESPRSKI